MEKQTFTRKETEFYSCMQLSAGR